MNWINVKDGIPDPYRIILVCFGEPSIPGTMNTENMGICVAYWDDREDQFVECFQFIVEDGILFIPPHSLSHPLNNDVIKWAYITSP